MRLLKLTMASRIFFLLAAMLYWSAWAGEVQVAVAANFAAPMRQIVSSFEQNTGHKIAYSVGATGKFYAQIKNAAPFDILLSADQTTPEQLRREREADGATQFTYAVGKLVLWSANPQLVDEQGDVLKFSDRFRHLAIASPKLAPYGVAAIETLRSLQLLDGLAVKLVQGESIGQTYAFIATGGAELGFIALSQVMENNKIKSGSVWVVPEKLYKPLRQDAILLKHGKDNPVALALLAFLKTESAKKIIRTFGYQI